MQSFKCFETTKKGCLVYLYCNRSDILFCSLHLVAVSEFVVASSATRYTIFKLFVVIFTTFGLQNNDLVIFFL